MALKGIRFFAENDADENVTDSWDETLTMVGIIIKNKDCTEAMTGKMISILIIKEKQ